MIEYFKNQAEHAINLLLAFNHNGYTYTGHETTHKHKNASLSPHTTTLIT